MTCVISICPVLSESSLCAQWVAEDPSLLHVDSKESDQTGWMPMLIWVYAGCTGHFAGFVVPWLTYFSEKNSSTLSRICSCSNDIQRYLPMGLSTLSISLNIVSMSLTTLSELSTIKASNVPLSKATVNSLSGKSICIKKSTSHYIHVHNEPPHDKTNKMACAPSEDSDQLGHLPSLIRVFAVRM